jgi:23S rRNA pseudouridine1911/1915/1917 synthase
MVEAQHTPEEHAEGEAQESEVERRCSIVSTALHGQRLDKAVVALVPEFSRNHLQGLIEGGHVQVDGRLIDTASRKVSAGQAIEIELVPTAESRAFIAEALPLRIVFEDEHLLVVDKAAGMVVHPAAGNWSGTLLNALLAHHRGAASLPRAGIVHRLDKDTSGLMVVAKTLAAATALVRAIAAREVHREYRAIAHGRIVADEFSVDAPIGRDPQSRVRMAVFASGKPARPMCKCWREATRRVRCAACCTAGGPTRSACIWPRAATRWSPTPSMAVAPRSACSARPCMLRGSNSPIRSSGSRSRSRRRRPPISRRPGNASTRSLNDARPTRPVGYNAPNPSRMAHGDGGERLPHWRHAR